MAVSALTGRACVCLACANLCSIYSIPCTRRTRPPRPTTSSSAIPGRVRRICTPQILALRFYSCVFTPRATCGVRLEKPPLPHSTAVALAAMTIVHSSQLYKRSKFRYKPTTLSLHLNELEETELRYGRSGCRERVVPWRKVLGVHVLADTCAFEFDTKDGPIRFRAHAASDIDKWCSCLPQVMHYSQSGSSALDRSAALSEESPSHRGDEVSTRLTSIARAVGGRLGHEKGARWVLSMGHSPADFANAIDTLGAKMTPVTRASRAPAGNGGGHQSAKGEAQAQGQEQPAQAGGHAGALRCGVAGTIIKDSIEAEALFYEETVPQLVEIGACPR